MKETSYLEYLKLMGLIDIVVLSMLEMGFGPSEISAKAHVSRQTVYDIKKKQTIVRELIRGQKQG